MLFSIVKKKKKQKQQKGPLDFFHSPKSLEGDLCCGVRGTFYFVQTSCIINTPKVEMQAWYSHKNSYANKAMFWGIKTNVKKS